jgi:hypothetical protein
VLPQVTMADGKKAVMLAFDTMNNPSAAHHGLDQNLWSHDDGRTWVGHANLSFALNDGGLIGPAVGLQSANGTLYLSYISSSEAGHPHHLLWSHDLGGTWRASTAVAGIGECSIAFLVSPADGRIIMNCRTSRNARAQLVWSADGVPGDVTFPEGLIDANCQGSIINSGGTLYTSNAADTHGRAHMTIKSSRDMGATWSSGVEVRVCPHWHACAYAYACVRVRVGARVCACVRVLARARVRARACVRRHGHRVPACACAGQRRAFWLLAARLARRPHWSPLRGGHGKLR